MNWTMWGLVVVVGVAAGALGAYLHTHGPALVRAIGPYRCGLIQRFVRRLRTGRAAIPTRRHKRPARLDAMILMPDGRPCPLGPAVQILELAWRWQVVHGANLPIRARHGEGAYVWRPPLPRSTDQVTTEAER